MPKKLASPYRVSNTYPKAIHSLQEEEKEEEKE